MTTHETKTKTTKDGGKVTREPRTVSAIPSRVNEAGARSRVGRKSLALTVRLCRPAMGLVYAISITSPCPTAFRSDPEREYLRKEFVPFIVSVFVLMWVA